MQSLLADRWQKDLDDCHGECVLRKPELAEVIAGSLRHFDGVRYELLDFVVMPNHVHLLVVFSAPDLLLTQCTSWKHFTAKELNRRLQRTGRFWQSDGFDHLVRSDQQFLWLRRYIAENPSKANLQAGEFLHYSKVL